MSTKYEELKDRAEKLRIVLKNGDILMQNIRRVQAGTPGVVRIGEAAAMGSMVPTIEIAVVNCTNGGKVKLTPEMLNDISKVIVLHLESVEKEMDRINTKLDAVDELLED